MLLGNRKAQPVSTVDDWTQAQCRGREREFSPAENDLSGPKAVGWRNRSAQLIQTCNTCPVLALCRQQRIHLESTVGAPPGRDGRVGQRQPPRGIAASPVIAGDTLTGRRRWARSSRRHKSLAVGQLLSTGIHPARAEWGGRCHPRPYRQVFGGSAVATAGLTWLARTSG